MFSPAFSLSKASSMHNVATKSRSIKVKGKRCRSRIKSPRINSPNSGKNHNVSKKTFSLRLAKEFAKELSYGYSSMIADNSHNQHAATNGG
jgi:hypothetical protein